MPAQLCCGILRAQGVHAVWLCLQAVDDTGATQAAPADEEPCAAAPDAAAEVQEPGDAEPGAAADGSSAPLPKKARPSPAPAPARAPS